MLCQDYPDRECQAEGSTKRPHQGGGCSLHREQITLKISTYLQFTLKFTPKKLPRSYGNLDNKEEAQIVQDNGLDLHKNCYKYSQKLSNIIAAL